MRLKVTFGLAISLLLPAQFLAVPAHAAAALNTTWSPSLSLSGTTLTLTLPDWNSSTYNNGSLEQFILACPSAPLTPYVGSPNTTVLNQGPCEYLSSSNSNPFTSSLDGLNGTVSVDLASQYLFDGANFLNWASAAGSVTHLVIQSYVSSGSAPNVIGFNVFSTIAVDPSSSFGSTPGSTPGSEDEVPPPVYFGGPVVMGSTLPNFTQGEEGTVTLTGKRMNKITSATINGVAVTVTADRRSATITAPATLAAGTYDLVLQTTNGRLTVMRFIKVS